MEIIKKGKDRFYIGDNESSALAEITFSMKSKDLLIIERTSVSEALRGQGIGRQLVKKVADYARQENMKIKPHCKFAQKVMTDSDEYRDILAES